MVSSFYRKFSEIVAPLSLLTRKNARFEWNDQCERAFLRLKECLASPPVLTYPDFTKPFEVHCDASGYGIVSVLSQKHEG